MEPIKIYQSQKQIVRSLVASLVAFALFLAIILFGWEDAFTIMKVLSAVCVPVFGISSVYYVVRLFLKNRPLIVLDQEGLHDDTSPLGVGLVRWDEINDETPIMTNNQPALRLDVTDTDAILARIPALKRLAVRARLWFLRAENAVPVSVTHTALSPDELIRSTRAVRAAATGSPEPRRPHPRSSGGQAQDAPAPQEGGYSKYDS